MLRLDSDDAWTKIDDDGVVLAGRRIPSKTVIWTAGVAPSPAGKWLQTEMDRAGRVRIQRDLTVPGYPEILIITPNAESMCESGPDRVPSIYELGSKKD